MIREYGADFGGPIVKDKLWLWFAGAYQTISTNQTTFSHELRHVRRARPGQPRALERQAELADLQRELGAALLPAQRPDPDATRAPDRRARPLAQTQLTIPTNFYKVEDSHVFSSDLFASIFAAYQGPDYTDLGNGSKDCAPTDFTIACAQEGTTKDA